MKRSEQLELKAEFDEFLQLTRATSEAIAINDIKGANSDLRKLENRINKAIEAYCNQAEDDQE